MFITIPEAAMMLGITEQAVRAHVRTNKLPAARTRLRLIDIEALARFKDASVRGVARMNIEFKDESVKVEVEENPEKSDDLQRAPIAAEPVPEVPISEPKEPPPNAE